MLVVLYALLRGRRDERQVGVILVARRRRDDLALLAAAPALFAGLETDVMLVDVAVFAGFLWVALRSERFWPLWIAGLQLTTMLGHAFKLIDTGLFSRAYGAALAFWGYPIVLILAIGTWRAQRRMRSRDDFAPA